MTGVVTKPMEGKLSRFFTNFTINTINALSIISIHKNNSAIQYNFLQGRKSRVLKDFSREWAKVLSVSSRNLSAVLSTSQAVHLKE